MSKRNVKICVISVIIIMFVLCFAMGTVCITDVFAEEITVEQTQIIEEEAQMKEVNTVTSETKDSSDKSSEYVNLGGARLSEGDQGLSQIYYIDNANYFLSNPKHRENYSTSGDHPFGTCTTVAHQILLGYHNYYSDRRLIPEFNSDGERYLSENYGDLNLDPIFKYDPTGTGLGRTNIGTTDAVFYGIFDKAGGSSLLSQTIGNVAQASDEFLEECANGRDKNWTITKTNYNKQKAKEELEAGRPIIVGFDVFGGRSSHVVVAYGYANYDGNFCYITHYGWSSGNVQMLVPESWLGYQVTMTVDHAHTYELILGETYTMGSGSTVYNAAECEVCGSTTLVDMATLFDGGTGTVSDPFLISNAEQFDNIRFAYRSVYVPMMGSENQINYAFRLTQSIVLPGDWVPFAYKFTGDFDGDDYYITYNMNLTQADINENIYQGLFGFVTSGGKVYDLELMNCTITSDTDTELQTTDSGVNIGILAGSIFEGGTISNIKVTNPGISCKISNASIGALAGSVHITTVTNCVVRQVNGTANIVNNTHGYIGGMAGLGDIVGFNGGCVTITLTNTAFNEETDMMGKVVGNAGDTVPSGMEANVTMNKNGCIATGTLITLADGTQKAVEDLTGDELLLVWNLQTGQFDTAPILFIDSDPTYTYSVIDLAFSDGTTVQVISEHGFWDYNLNEYVYLDMDAAQYIGHWFNKLTTDAEGNNVSTRVQLTDVTITEEVTAAYSPVTYSHLCYYVNGMLSMPGGIEGMFNIFEVDEETMKYDEAQMQADIAQYGLFTYEEFAQIVPVTEDVFEAFNGQYMKVAIGKGLITETRLLGLAQRYAEYLT